MSEKIVPPTELQKRIIRALRRRKVPLYYGPRTDFTSTHIIAPEQTVLSMRFKGLITYSVGRSGYVLTRLGKTLDL